jgi:HD-GYP domain-containing protein (c-di-GMP phosphodiesterase class II)
MSCTESEAREIENAYKGILNKMNELSGESSVETLRKALSDLIDFIIEKLSSEDECLLLYNSKVFDKDYISAHSLDVCLISIRIGLRLGFEKGRLKDLGFLALTHASQDMGFPKELVEGLRRDQKMEEIVRLADIYDAITHPPTYRDGMIPRETLESMICCYDFVDRSLLKIILEEISLYPKGTWVELSTKEIGRVIKVNRGLPLRPEVEVFVDWEGNYLEEPKTVDLSQKNLIRVVRPLTEEEIKHIKEN